MGERAAKRQTDTDAVVVLLRIYLEERLEYAH